MSGSGRIVSIFNYKANGLTSEQEEVIGKRELSSLSSDVERWDFLRQCGTKDIANYSSFDVFEHGKYVAHVCTECGCEYNLPNYQKTCLKCGGEKVKARDRRVGKCGTIKGVTGLYDGVHPELYKQAVQDLKDHPVPQSTVEPDWGYLESNL